MTAEASESLGLPLLGAIVTSMEPEVCTDVHAGAAIDVGAGTTVREDTHVEIVLCPIISRAGNSAVVASVGGVAAAVRVTPSVGRGSLLLLASSGVASKPVLPLPLRQQVRAIS